MSSCNASLRILNWDGSIYATFICKLPEGHGSKHKSYEDYYEVLWEIDDREVCYKCRRKIDEGEVFTCDGCGETFHDPCLNNYENYDGKIIFLCDECYDKTFNKQSKET